MDQKKINIFFVVCIVLLSLVCFWQHKKIRELEDVISSLEYDLSSADGDIDEIRSDLDSISSSVSDLQSEISGNYQRPSAREIYNQLEERERKRREASNRRKNVR